jgi:hypothetical protein
MKLRHAAALALMGWYLIDPPFVRLPNGQYDAKTDAPLSEWLHVASFDEASLCEAARAFRVNAGKEDATKDSQSNDEKVMAAIGPYCECVSTDDPRLNPK